LLACLLATVTAPALAQGLGSGLGLEDVVTRARGGAPLDGFSQPLGAYSFRKLKSDYAGSAMRIRRASDSGELDIGFTAAGDFNAAVAVAHCAATTCTAVKWYDQSGNARDLAPSAAGPAVFFSCIGELPCLRFFGGGTVLQGATLTPATGVASLSSVSRRFSGTTSCLAVSQVTGGNRLYFTATTASYTLAGGGGTVVAPQAEAAWHVVSGVVNGAASNLTVDGVAVTGSVTGSVAAGVPGLSGGSATNCDSVEAVFWDNYALTADERTALQANQRNYWTPLPLDTFSSPSGAYSFRKLRSAYAGPAIRIRRASDNLETDIAFLGFTGFTGAPIDTAAAVAHCNATTCFVRTFYDQSGNSRHLVQATPATQPGLVFDCVNSLPCLQTTSAGELIVTASGFTPATGTVTMSAVTRLAGGGTGNCTYIRTNNGTRILSATGQWVLQSGAVTINTASGAADNVWHAGLGIIAGASSSIMSIDGVETSNSTGGTNVAAGQMGILAGATAVCRVVEAMIWDNYVLTAGERAALVSNQRSFWGF